MSVLNVSEMQRTENPRSSNIKPTDCHLQRNQTLIHQTKLKFEREIQNFQKNRIYTLDGINRTLYSSMQSNQTLNSQIKKKNLRSERKEEEEEICIDHPKQCFKCVLWQRMIFFFSHLYYFFSLFPFKWFRVNSKGFVEVEKKFLV